jgi:hypothetical protein
VEYLVEKAKVDVNTVTETGSAAVLVAIEYNHMPLLQYLVETGKANINLLGKVSVHRLYLFVFAHLCLL